MGTPIRGGLSTLIYLDVLIQKQEREGRRLQTQTGMDGELTHPLAVSTSHPDVSEAAGLQISGPHFPILRHIPGDWSVGRHRGVWVGGRGANQTQISSPICM